MRSSLIHLAAMTILGCACGGLEIGSREETSAPTAAPPSYPLPPPSNDAPPLPPQTVPSNETCPEVAAPPIDCGPYADVCAGVTPLAVGTFARIADVAVDATSIYWTATYTDLTPGCGGTIYRTPKAGGASERIITARNVGTIAADGATLYWSEYRSGGAAIDYHAWSGGTETALGTITDDGAAYGSPLVATPGGVIFANNLAMWHATPTALERVASASTFYLASLPTFDGVSVFASTFPYTASADLATVSRLGSSDPSAIAGGAASRGRRSVVAAGADLFFLTGDEMGDGEHLFRPMGISRVAKTGGAPVVLVPSSDTPIWSLAVDASFVYFIAGATVSRVPRDGGAVSVVAVLGATPTDLVVDDSAIYFLLPAVERHGEITGPGNVIASVPK